MTTIWIGLLIFIIGWHFYYQRQLAETARAAAHKYCENHGIQFVSIAKVKSRLTLRSGEGINWRNHYLFEFSGDGQSSYEGTLVLLGNRVESINTPVYRT